MTEIKAGQVYKCDYADFKGNFAITLIDGVYVYQMYNDGTVGRIHEQGVRETDNTLIATYPTWQEAVNSKEFNQ